MKDRFKMTISACFRRHHTTNYLSKINILIDIYLLERELVRFMVISELKNCSDALEIKRENQCGMFRFVSFRFIRLDECKLHKCKPAAMAVLALAFKLDLLIKVIDF